MTELFLVVVIMRPSARPEQFAFKCASGGLLCHMSLVSVHVLLPPYSCSRLVLCFAFLPLSQSLSLSLSSRTISRQLSFPLEQAPSNGV